MRPLTGDDRLPLTCTRLGTCCHGHRIVLCPWELAWLAHGLKVTPRDLRDTRMTAGGTQLRNDGPLGQHGPPAHRVAACTLYALEAGCRAHAHRPLACRLYPLGRERHEGRIRYYHPGDTFPCRVLCPTVESLPERTVDVYLAEQATAAGEAAHDAYAALAYGLVNAALVLADGERIARATLAAEFAAMCTWTPDERAMRLGTPWYDLLTIPDLPATADGRAFAEAHARLLAATIQAQVTRDAAPDALGTAARRELLLALHLGATVGALPTVMATLIQPSPPLTP